VARAKEPDTDAAAAQRQTLLDQLHAATGPAAASEAAAPEACAEAPPDGPRTCGIQVQFGVNTFRHGMDPVAILRYLDRYGSSTEVTCDLSRVPELDRLDPEECHLSVQLQLHTDAPHDQIMQAFTFVAEESAVEVIEPARASRPTAQPIATAAEPAPAAAQADAPAPKRVPEASPAPAASGQPRASREGAVNDDGGHIRVLANRLDEVINLLGELVVAGAGASMLAQRSRQRQLIEANQQISRLIESIRNSTLKLRMVPIGDTFTRFRRVVRDTATELGKDVALEIVGGETELDKAVVERIADPLMHLVRNGLDHGLETPEQREANGKPGQGKLTLSACHEAGMIVIRIIDDGRGIQRQKVLQRAWDRGLVPPGTVPSDSDILQLIFEPGFSTAEQVTNLSGRGVGMDVVRSNIEALRGSVTIDSVEGQGSTIEIRLPLTLAIIDGFLVGAGASRFIFPLETVVEVFSNHKVVATCDANGRGVVDLRGNMLPLLDLRKVYALKGPVPERRSVVVVSIGLRRYGVLVDTLLGQHQTVIKPLGKLLRSLKGISGSSILGTGEVAMIFDVETLGQLAEAGRKRTPLVSRHTETAPINEAGLTLTGDLS
jgi:two-component system chemotaxis sensor kinase CheA